MTPRELFEYANLDVMGLLDEQERELFERAFQSAPPHVQAQVRAEQTRCAKMHDLLPAVEAPAGLRSKVMAAVREAIATVRTEPIAKIGSGGRTNWSAPLWRAACIGFMTASMVLAFFAYKVSEDNKQISALALSNSVSDDVARRAGARFTDLLTKPSMRHVAFAPAAQDYDGKAGAALFVDMQTKTAYLVCNDLPIAGGTYKLVIEQGGGESSVKEFQATSGSFFVAVEVIDPDAVGRLRIQAPQTAGGRHETLLVASGV